MDTVFSHIVQRRLSQENENVATDALAFILDHCESARIGLMKLLRGVAPELPNLRFRTQESVEKARPDMWGFDGPTPRVYIENKFWAGLTENQPVTYLVQLSKHPKPAVLLVTVPEARQETVWRELLHRLGQAGIKVADHSSSAGMVHAVQTYAGPVLALTSWTKLLSAVDSELANEPSARNDLAQLRALCGAADLNAFTPITAEELTDQRTPAFVLQILSIIEAAVDLAASETPASIEEGKGAGAWGYSGQYLSFRAKGGFSALLCLDFETWKECGSTPLWLYFYQDYNKGKMPEIQRLLEPWCSKLQLPSFMDTDFALGLDLPVGEEKDEVVRHVANRLSSINSALAEEEPQNG